MSSHDQLKETLKDMGFEERVINGALFLLKENATLETVLDAIDTGKAAAEAKRLEENPELAKQQEEQKPKELTEEEKAAKKRDIEEKIRKRREENAKAEAEEERLREIQRRKDGQGVGKVREEIEQLAQQRHIEALKKEKDEAKAARDAILRQIEADKAERRARMEGQNPAAASSAAPATKAPQLTSQPSKNGKTKLAIRLLDGSQLVEEFEDREPLASVRAFVVSKKNIVEDISFSMPPLRAFNEQDMQMSLFGLGLSPNARLTVVRRSP